MQPLSDDISIDKAWINVTESSILYQMELIISLYRSG